MNALSVTLRDAQHLCWKTFKKLETVDPESSKTFSRGDYISKKVEEFIQKAKTPEAKEELAKLLSEMLFATFVAAEQQGVDLEESFLQSVNDIILGFVG